MQCLFDENNRLQMAGYWYLCNKTIVKICVFVLNMHYMHPGYWTSICGKNCTYCNRILRYVKTVLFYCSSAKWSSGTVSCLTYTTSLTLTQSVNGSRVYNLIVLSLYQRLLNSTQHYV